MFKPGDKIIRFAGSEELISHGTIVTVKYSSKNSQGEDVVFLNEFPNNWYSKNWKLIEPERKNMLKEVAQDVKSFVREHRSVVYTVAFVMLVDHFVFGGAFRERVKAMLDKLLSKAEKQIDVVKS